MVGLEGGINFGKEVEVDLAKALLLDFIAGASQAEFGGLVGADVRVGAGKYLCEFAEPFADLRKGAGVAGGEHVAVRAFHRWGSTARI